MPTALGLSEACVDHVVSFVFLIALSLVFNVIGMEIFKMQEARNRQEAPCGLRRPRCGVLAGVALAAVVAAIGAGIAWNWTGSSTCSRCPGRSALASARCHCRIQRDLLHHGPVQAQDQAGAADRDLSPALVHHRPVDRLRGSELLALQHRPERPQPAMSWSRTGSSRTE